MRVCKQGLSPLVANLEAGLHDRDHNFHPLFIGIVADLGMKMMHHPSLYNQRPPEPVSELTAHTNKVYCSQLAERISQDNCITAGLSKR